MNKIVKFGTLTEQEWKKLGIEINIPISKNSGTSEYGTLYDLRLGALENKHECETCGQSNLLCPGHWGYIDLAEPCYNPKYIEIVLGIFKCVCIFCGELRIKNTITNNTPNVRFKLFKKKAELATSCFSCGAKHPTLLFDPKQKTLKIVVKGNPTPLTARQSLSIMSKISDESLKIIGIEYSRPESFIYTILPVLPTAARPWIIKGGERKDDDLTKCYNTIIKHNNKLKGVFTKKKKDKINKIQDVGRNDGIVTFERQKDIETIQSSIWALIDNSKETGTNRSYKSIQERLGRKEGQIQNNVAGKRADYSARSVISSGGMMIPMGWIGIPKHVADTLTVPEAVTPWNMEYINKLMKDKEIVSIARDNSLIDVESITKGRTIPLRLPIFGNFRSSNLSPGDVVNRKLKDGDWGIFNRQPTLRIESIQGVQVKVLPGKKQDDVGDFIPTTRPYFYEDLVFRLPLGATRPFNADN